MWLDAHSSVVKNILKPNELWTVLFVMSWLSRVNLELSPSLPHLLQDEILSCEKMFISYLLYVHRIRISTENKDTYFSCQLLDYMILLINCQVMFFIKNCQVTLI